MVSSNVSKHGFFQDGKSYFLLLLSPMCFMGKGNNVPGNVIFLSGCFSRQNSAGEGEAEIYSVKGGVGTYTDTYAEDRV